ncbi:peptidoglycan-binding protein [Kitasatospora sp. NPDC089913]|uniref:peptidoglycan-binding protein n=1 Tax=Kitasatospora sp. NPDC089913 TaxID=3364080 RepID=UPI00382954A0
MDGHVADAAGPEPVPAPRRGHRFLAALVATAVAAGIGGTAATRFITSPGQRAAQAAAPPPSVITAAVESRRLVDTVVLRGRVAATQSVEVSPQVVAGGKDTGSRTVVTAVRVRPGDAVSAGQVLLEVSGRPVFVLTGELPVYRDLKPGSEGKDVEQLQRSLARQGLKTGADEAGRYGPGTRRAVEELYRRLGYDAPQSPDVSPEQLRTARERVTSAERAAGGVPPAGPGPEPGAGPRSGPDSAGRAVAYAKADLERAREERAELESRAGAMVPAGEVVLVRDDMARVDTVNAVVGKPVKERAVTLSSGALLVVARLAPHQKDLVRSGMPVRILSELTGAQADASVTAVADTPDTADTPDPAGGPAAGPGGSSAAGGRAYATTVTPTVPLDPALAGQDVRLTVEAASSDGDVLVVPLAAVSAGADGRTLVTVLAADGSRRPVEVRPGATGGGFIQVAPADPVGLRPGERVVVGVRRGAATDTGTGGDR